MKTRRLGYKSPNPLHDSEQSIIFLSLSFFICKVEIKQLPHLVALRIKGDKVCRVRFEQHLNEGIGVCGEVHFQPRNPVQWLQIEKNHPYFRYSKPSALPREPAPYKEGVPIKSLAHPVCQVLCGVWKVPGSWPGRQEHMRPVSGCISCLDS